MAWYPLSGIVLHSLRPDHGIRRLLGVMIGYGPDLVSQIVDLMMASVQASEALSSQTRQRLRRRSRFWF